MIPKIHWRQGFCDGRVPVNWTDDEVWFVAVTTPILEYDYQTTYMWYRGHANDALQKRHNNDGRREEAIFKAAK